MKKNKFFSLIIAVLSIYSLHAQEQTSKNPFDHVFRNVNKVGATTGIFCAPSSEEEKKIQAPYKHSIGGIMHIFAYGPSYKVFFSKKIALQTDVFLKLLLTEGDASWGTLAIYSSVSINANLIYNKQLRTNNSYDLFLLMGSGASFGITPIQVNRKLGANVIMGVEFVYKSLLTIQLDVRPGYGFLFNPPGRLDYIKGGELFELHTYPLYSPWHHFDWSFGITIRKAYKKDKILK